MKVKEVAEVDLAGGTLEENMDLVCMELAVEIQDILEARKAVVFLEAQMDLQENWVDNQEDVWVEDLKVDQMVEVACKHKVIDIFKRQLRSPRAQTSTFDYCTLHTHTHTHKLTREMEGLVVADLVFYSRDICL